MTGPGKLTVGKLYGGILIYEIWKTTRFSNLEILAKVKILTSTKVIRNTQALQSWLGDFPMISRWKRRWRVNWRPRGAWTWRQHWRVATQSRSHPVHSSQINDYNGLQAKEDELIEDVGLATREEEREEYDQYNDDPTFNNRQREYYNQR